MRIVSGIHRGKPLQAPTGLATRPTSDRVREALFNMLAHAPWAQTCVLDGAEIMDLFAGTGALGLEALSRGARHCVFVDNLPAALKTCEVNIEKMGERERSLVMKADATQLKPRPSHIAPRTLVFLDPPYGKDLGTMALQNLADGGWLQSGSIAVMEMRRQEPEEPVPGFTLADTRVWGDTRVDFWVFQV